MKAILNFPQHSLEGRTHQAEVGLEFVVENLEGFLLAIEPLGGWKWNGPLVPKALLAEAAIFGLSALQLVELVLAEAHLRMDRAHLVCEVFAEVLGPKLSASIQ